MKNLINLKNILSLFVTMITLNSYAQLHKFIVCYDGYIKAGTMQDALLDNGRTIIVGQDWIAPSTKQKVKLNCHPSYLRTFIPENEIMELEWIYTSEIKGEYINTGLSDAGVAVPIGVYGLPTSSMPHLGVRRTGRVYFKGNCANPQLLKEVYVAPAPLTFTPALVPTGKKMYVPCLNKEVEMELTGEGTSYWWSKDRAYVLWDGVWNYATGNGNQVKELTCEPAPDASSGSVTNNYYNTYNSYTTSSPNTMNALYNQQPIPQYYPEVRHRDYNGLIVLGGVVASALLQTRYASQQVYTTSPQVQWNGVMSNSGSYYNNYGTSTGNSSNGGSGGYSTGNSSNSGSGGYSTGNSSNSGGGNAGEWTIISRD